MRAGRGLVMCVLLFFATACSGQNPGVHVPTAAQLASGLFLPSMPPPLSLGAPVAQIVGSLVGDLGLDVGTAALVQSLDAGWVITQVADAILDGRLLPDGSVLDPSGGLLPKEGSPLDNFIDAIAGFARSQPTDSLDEFIAGLVESTESVEDNPSRVAAAADTMIRLEAGGYPLAQVIQFVPGGYVLHVPGEATVLFDVDGAFVCPSAPTAAIDCGDLTEEWAEAAPAILPSGVVDDPSPPDDTPEPDDTEAPDDTDGPIAIPGETCANGTVSLAAPVEGVTVHEDDFGVCFAATGGSVTGSFNFIADVEDEACQGLLEITGTLTGDYAPPAIGGPAEVFASFEDTRGDCALFDEDTISTTLTATTWSGTVTDGVLVATLIDDGADALRFDATVD